MTYNATAHTASWYMGFRSCRSNNDNRTLPFSTGVSWHLDIAGLRKLPMIAAGGYSRLVVPDPSVQSVALLGELS